MMMKVVHLPIYCTDAYQPLLMKSLASHGVIAIDGGGGGNFFRTGLFRWKAEIYHFHWLHPYLLQKTRISSVLRATRFLVEVALLKLSGARVVWTVHNLVNHDHRFTALERFYSRLFVRLANGIIVHSQVAFHAVKKSFNPGRRLLTAVIPQGSYIGYYPNSMSRDECRTRLGLKKDGLIFLFFGRIEAYKGVPDLIVSFKQLTISGHLLIVGSISDAELLKRLEKLIGAAPNIHLCEGFVPEDMVQIYFNASDVFVYPVHNILNSGSISLAMSFGLPCIAPNRGALLELLGHVGGIIYDPDEPNGLRKALQLAVQRESELHLIGRSNLERAKSWTWDMVAERTVELYRKCL